MTSTDFAYRGDMAPRAAIGYHPRFNISTPVLRLHDPGRHLRSSRWQVLGAIALLCPRRSLRGPDRHGSRRSALPRPARRSRRSSAASSPSRQSSRCSSPPPADASSTLGSDGSAAAAIPEDAGHYWEHLGGGGGFFNTMRIYPKLKLGLVAMGNATNWDHLRLVPPFTPEPEPAQIPTDCRFDGHRRARGHGSGRRRRCFRDLTAPGRDARSGRARRGSGALRGSDRRRWCGSR